MKISDNVRMVPVPEDQPMRPTSTNIYIIGQRGGQTLTIDSGEAIDKFRWMLRGYLAAIDHSEIGVAAITHHHFDHSGNLKHVNEHLKAEVAVPENGVKLLRGRLPKDGVKTYADGDTIELDGGIRVQVMTSPGHSVDSLCYYIEEEGILFTGDTILGNTTSVVGDVNSYMASLRRLLELPNVKVLCPGHGPLITDTDDAKARDRLEMYVAHRQMREDQIQDLAFPEEMPVIRNLAVDWSDRIWVQRSALPGETGTIDILSADGRYFGSLPTDGLRIPRAFGPGGLLAYVERDDLDIQRVVVVRLMADEQLEGAP